MNALIAALAVVGRLVFLLAAAPFLLAGAFAVLCASDLLGGRRRGAERADQPVRADAVSVVIPNWNGRGLLAKNLPSVVEALGSNPGHELIVVDMPRPTAAPTFSGKPSLMSPSSPWKPISDLAEARTPASAPPGTTSFCCSTTICASLPMPSGICFRDSPTPCLRGHLADLFL